MAFLVLASLPNSRIKPRPSTSLRDTKIAVTPSGIASLVAPENINRTNIVLKNLDSVNSVWYGYDDQIDDQSGNQGGMELKAGEAATIDVTTDIYVYQESGSNIEIGIDEGSG